MAETEGISLIPERSPEAPKEVVDFDFDLDKYEASNAIIKEQYETHLKWLLSEGQGETFFELGLDSTGVAVGLEESVFESHFKKLNEIACSVGAVLSLVCERSGKSGGKVAAYMVRESTPEVYVDVRYCVCGNVDSGKSTMVGVLTRGQLDNGRGLVRVNCFAHKHEISTGRTSSISQQIMGFNLKGECVNQVMMDANAAHTYSWGDIIEQSFKVVSFLDLAGHEKYLKTTVSGMTGHMPDYCLLLIGANMGVTRMTKEHLGIALALKIPVVVVITKIDMCPANVLKQTMGDIQKILKMRGVKKISLVVRTNDDLITAVKAINNDRIVPIFLLSNVTGENLDTFRKFLNVVPARIQWDVLREKPAEVLIDQTYFVTGVGTVVGGTVMAGRVLAGQTLLLGPDSNGLFIPVQIKSVHSKRVPVKQVVAGQSAGFALKKIKRSMIRKGMVLVDAGEKPQATWTFEADIIVLYHSTTIHTNYQPVVQCMTIRQSARISHILERDVLRTGDRANVRFKFLYRPEYLKVGMRLIFREGRCKGIGIISKVKDIPDEEPAKPAVSSTANPSSPTTGPVSSLTEVPVDAEATPTAAPSPSPAPNPSPAPAVSTTKTAPPPATSPPAPTATATTTATATAVATASTKAPTGPASTTTKPTATAKPAATKSTNPASKPTAPPPTKTTPQPPKPSPVSNSTSAAPAAAPKATTPSTSKPAATAAKPAVPAPTKPTTTSPASSKNTAANTQAAASTAPTAKPASATNKAVSKAPTSPTTIAKPAATSKSPSGPTAKEEPPPTSLQSPSPNATNTVPSQADRSTSTNTPAPIDTEREPTNSTKSNQPEIPPQTTTTTATAPVPSPSPSPSANTSKPSNPPAPSNKPASNKPTKPQPTPAALAAAKQTANKSNKPNNPSNSNKSTATTTTPAAAAAPAAPSTSKNTNAKSPNNKK